MPTATSIERPAVSSNERRGDLILLVCDRSTTERLCLVPTNGRDEERVDPLVHDIDSST